jgi:hypothetical protein
MRKGVGVTILLVLSVATLVILSPTSSTNSNSNEGSGTAGMMAYLDPETGEITTGPAPSGEIELDADTQNALRHDTEGLEIIRHADGSESIDLQGRFQSVSTVRIDENGKAIVCTDNVVTTEKALTSTQPIPATPEVK